MQLKKINPLLQQGLIEAGFTDANDLQAGTFTAIKSGVDVVVQSGPGTGKTTTMVLNILQKLGKPEGESTRALVFVADRDAVTETVALFEKLGQYMGLRIYGVHEKGDTDYDKNLISLGLDILVGTPVKLSALFSTAGFNLNTVRVFAVDDADVLFRNRQDAAIARLSASAERTQRLFYCSEITEKVEIMAEKWMIEPLFFEADDDASDQD
ncbi:MULTISPECIES: DEAD/DEAH box helicase [unclassified Flavobacterium]|uniref:DEAD/DEAH box helicase n=1 Tax=unclassified Flavobacterium TaxID=196869 RepID=UPI001F131E0C|nr:MULTISPECIES: DEAD/DEAH box helicase [unclassified Flavobacterium]UMY65693.1 DEAD/DEAH box helicase [Flavobacterium sp. HJ-32-4]